MIVLDASAVVELLLTTETGRAVGARLADPTASLHVPHRPSITPAWDARPGTNENEAGRNTLRRYVRAGELTVDAAGSALEDLRALDIERHAHEPLLERVWALRGNLTAYDAVYVALAEALAEALDTRLLTCDARLARAPGLTRRVELAR